MITLSTSIDAKLYTVEFVNLYAYSSYIELVKASKLNDVVDYANSCKLTIKKIYKSEEIPLK